MDERLLPVVFLLLAGVLPLQGLAARWDGRPERRGAVRALWIGYGLIAIAAVAALLWTRDAEAERRPPLIREVQQLAGSKSEPTQACAESPARA